MSVVKLFTVVKYAHLLELEFVSGDVAEIGFPPLPVDNIFDGPGIFRLGTLAIMIASGSPPRTQQLSSSKSDMVVRC
jgi:hypothetical protein